MGSSRWGGRLRAAMVVSSGAWLAVQEARAELTAIEAVIETSALAEAVGYWTVNLYAVFDNPLDVIFNVYNRSATTTAGTFINIEADGIAVWDAPPAALMLLDPALEYDSFVTIGPATGDVNDTLVDPNFNELAFAEQGMICCDAGWYNSFPPNGQGVAGLYPGNKVLLARLTMPLLAGAVPATLTGSLQITYKDGGVEIIQTEDIAFAAVAPVLSGDCNGNDQPDAEEIAGDPLLDCNENQYIDACDVVDALSADLNGDGIPDECQFPLGDFTADGLVDGADLGVLLLHWGACGLPPICPGDMNDSSTVDGEDLGLMLLNWG